MTVWDAVRESNWNWFVKKQWSKVTLPKLPMRRNYKKYNLTTGMGLSFASNRMKQIAIFADFWVLGRDSHKLRWAWFKQQFNVMA